ncbi:MAG TPA: penicillin-binding protein 2 [Gaiellaceae bacterium]|nr:penicillin-binding protein 2 [Gaiellaceae bacterium]
MNQQISRLAVAGLVLVTALIVGTTYWQAWAAPSLADRQDNAIKVVAQFTIKRGVIYAGDGVTPLAINRPRRVAGKTFYFRRYPKGELTAHAVGYSTRARARTGLERSRNDYLTGANRNLSTVVDTTLDQLRGKTIEGNDIITTLRWRAQKVALDALGGQCGAAVALEPSTGKVLVLASSPSFDPNLVERNFAAIGRRRGPCPVAPLLNRGTAGLFIPGSTFKVVTAAAALDSGRYTPDSTFVDPGYCVEYGQRVNNYDTSSPFGRVSFGQALQHSINSAFCEMGKKLGAEVILDYARRFGFYEDPPVDLPSDERLPSGLYQDGKLVPRSQEGRSDPGRLAFGQERMLVTPMQMATVAATIANGGVVMKPYLTDRVRAPDGSIVQRMKPDELRRAIKRETAAELTSMMESVVSGGTGTAAQIAGVRVAGKTGTAETGRSGRNVAGFIAFAPVDNPKVAVAVYLQNQSATGGTVAAPIAKQIMEALLRTPSNSQRR